MSPSPTSTTVRLTVAQAVVRFLAAQWTERDGERHKLFAGCFGIFGHGNVAGIGQALLENVHAERATTGCATCWLATSRPWCTRPSRYARRKDRLQTWVCTASVGPGSTNMLTGAALATINRIPVLLLPSGTFATRVSSPVLQELEQPYAADVTVNDAFRPLSQLLRPGVPPRAVDLRPLRRDAGAHRPGRYRRRHHLAAPGRAGRGLRLARRPLRDAGLASQPCPGRPRRPRRRRGR